MPSLLPVMLSLFRVMLSLSKHDYAMPRELRNWSRNVMLSLSKHDHAIDGDVRNWSPSVMLSLSKHDHAIHGEVRNWSPFDKLRVTLGVALTFSLLGAAPIQLDSQYVLQRYAAAVQEVKMPRLVVYSYTVSQVGANNIEQHHRVYRSGLEVRDETLSVDGVALRRKIVRFSRRPERYAVARFAPRAENYQLLFLGTTRDGRHLDYVYEATPIARPSGATIDRLTIDGSNFLPRAVHFHTGAEDVTGGGNVVFGPSGKYWMPLIASAQAKVQGKPAREIITWSGYSFPQSLPPSTFQPPEPLPNATPTPPM